MDKIDEETKFIKGLDYEETTTIKEVRKII